MAKFNPIPGGVTAPEGYIAGAAACGLKKNGKTDLGLLFSMVSAQTTACFTANRVKAAPLLWDMAKLDRSSLTKAVLANSGNANACTGKPGLVVADKSATFAAKVLHITEREVFVCSTGVIGRSLPLKNIQEGVLRCVPQLSRPGHLSFAKAIMTTDTVPKECGVEVSLGKHKVRIGGCAKGSGMVNPNMVPHATVLVFLTTDASLSLALQKKALESAVNVSFNSLTVDGDASTNDTVVLLANGQSVAPKIEKEGPAWKAFTEGLTFVCVSLAKMLAADGEGATKYVEVCVKGAASVAEAQKAAKAVANSPLVKTALFGRDANWGRIMCALGNSGAKFDPEKTSISINKSLLVRNGQAVAMSEKEQNKLLQPKKILIEADLKNDKYSAKVFTCDLSVDYVRINGGYRS